MWVGFILSVEGLKRTKGLNKMKLLLPYWLNWDIVGGFLLLVSFCFLFLFISAFIKHQLFLDFEPVGSQTATYTIGSSGSRALGLRLELTLSALLGFQLANSIPWGFSASVVM